MSKDRKCPDCGGTVFVEDHAAGDVICRGCGLVVEEHIIDERSEWRTFSDKDKEGVDPNRVGGPTNPLLEGAGLTTMIGKGTGSDDSHMLNRMHARSNNPDRALTKAFKVISDMCERLHLANPNIRITAQETYKEVVAAGALKGRSVSAIAAACIFLSCRKNNNARSFKEICQVIEQNTVLKKDIGRCFKDIVNMYKDKEAARGANANTSILQAIGGQTTQRPADFMRRFVGLLQLPQDVSHKVLRAATEIAEAASPEANPGKHMPWEARHPTSIAGAILFVATQLKYPVAMQDIVTVTQAAEGTIRSTYKDLFPELARLIPRWYAAEHELRKLPAPMSYAPLPAPVSLPAAPSGMPAAMPAAAIGAPGGALSRSGVAAALVAQYAASAAQAQAQRAGMMAMPAASRPPGM